MAKKKNKKIRKKYSQKMKIKEVKNEEVEQIEEVKKEEKVKTKKEEKANSKEKKSFIEKPYIDIALVAIIIALAIIIHIPSLTLPNISSKSQYMNEQNLSYLFDMDSYYYARKAKEFTTGEETKLIRERKTDKLQTMISEDVSSYYTLLLPKVVSIIYKIINIFKKVDIYAVVVYSGPLLSALVCIPAYIFVKRKTNRVGAILASTLAVTASSYFAHQNFASFDTDILLYIVPLTFMLGFMECAFVKDKKSTYIYLAITIISYILLILLWDVYGVYYFLVAGLTLLFIIIALIKEKFNIKNVIKLPEVRNTFILVACFSLLSFLFRGGIETSLFQSILSMVKPSSFSTMNYPSPSKFVAELTSVPFLGSFKDMFSMETNNIVNRLGGIFVVLFYFIGLIFLLYFTVRYFKKNEEEDKSRYIMFVTLLIWSIGGIISIRSGARFVKIAAIPVNLTAGLALGYLYKIFKNFGIGFAVIIVTIGLCANPCIYAYQISSRSNPSVNKALEMSADFINENTEKNAVIASWWDFGYFYEYTTGRRAIGDGGVYNGRFFYFLANAFLTTDDYTSANIFKMLSYKGVTASVLMDKYVTTPKEGCKILLDILSKNKEDAFKALTETYKFDEEKANSIIELTHPELDYDIVLVITENMQRMKTAMSYYAYYDFEHDVSHMDMVGADTILLSLYNNTKDTENYKHLAKIVDPIERYSTSIWLIK